MAEGVACLRETLDDPRGCARLLAVSAEHGSEWLRALSIAACRLRMDDEAVRVAIGLRLGCDLCEPHVCGRGAAVDRSGIHGLSCTKSAGRLPRHHMINDIVCRALISTDVPSIKEPKRLLRSDARRPDGLTLVPWSKGKMLTWDATVTDTLALSNLSVSMYTPSAAAEVASAAKTLKYEQISATYLFVPLAVETLGPICEEGASFLMELGRCLSVKSGDPRETSFIFQRISVAIQRFSSSCIRTTFNIAPD